MELLTCYAEEAIRRNLVDEWHVWNFARRQADDLWLREQFPIIRRTPDDGTYYRVGRIEAEGPGGAPWLCSVRSDHDVHIRLTPADGSREVYEFVVGGWGNTRTALRRCEASETFSARTNETQSFDELVNRPTTGLLSKREFRELAIGNSADGLTLSVDGQPTVSHPSVTLTGAYDVHVMTAYGADAEWLFAEHRAARHFLYLSTRLDHPVWSDFYRYYAQLSQSEPDTIFLKSDDDVVYVQLSELENFVAFREDNRDYFLVSSNVVNNNVCAWYQQRDGAIPPDLMELELPEGGHQGRLWGSCALATLLHDHFLDHRDMFETVPRRVIEWRERLSINFVSWMGRDAVYMAAYMGDDEHAMSVEIPTYLGRPNGIYPGMLVSHLTFFPQDEGFEHKRILSRYRDLAQLEGVIKG